MEPRNQLIKSLIYCLYTYSPIESREIQSITLISISMYFKNFFIQTRNHGTTEPTYKVFHFPCKKIGIFSKCQNEDKICRDFCFVFIPWFFLRHFSHAQKFQIQKRDHGTTEPTYKVIDSLLIYIFNNRVQGDILNHTYIYINVF